MQLKKHPTSAENDGFALVELLVAIVIGTIGATAIMPTMRQQSLQTNVDAYTSKIESGLAGMKTNLLMRQGSCELYFPSGAQSNRGIHPNQLEELIIDHPSRCPRPAAIQDWNGQTLDMKTTALRLVSQKRTLNSNQGNDLRIIITPQRVSLTTIGGIAAPTAGSNQEALTIRVHSQELKNKGRGFERCIQLEVMTGTIIRGTWHESSKKCTHSS
jgi:prepilin-type N-terminal cleavage/methylation domain-containing protein